MVIFVRNTFDGFVLVSGFRTAVRVVPIRLIVSHIIAVARILFRGVDRRVSDSFHRRRSLASFVIAQINRFHTSNIAGGFFLGCLNRISSCDRVLPIDFSRFGLATGTCAAALWLLGLSLSLSLLAFSVSLFFGNQRKAVGHRNLVVIGVDFVERQETMAIAAIVNERRLKRRFYPCYFCEVDVASKLAAGLGFKVEFLNLVSVNHHNAGFFRVGGVDKHFLSHCVLFHAPFGGNPHNNPGGAALSGACSIMARRATAARAANWPPALSPYNVARSIALVSDHQLVARSRPLRLRMSSPPGAVHLIPPKINQRGPHSFGLSLGMTGSFNQVTATKNRKTHRAFAQSVMATARPLHIGDDGVTLQRQSVTLRCLM